MELVLVLPLGTDGYIIPKIESINLNSTFI